MSQLIAKCLRDNGFKRKFMADPEAVLKAEGIAVPVGCQDCLAAGRLGYRLDVYSISGMLDQEVINLSGQSSR